MPLMKLRGHLPGQLHINTKIIPYLYDFAHDCFKLNLQPLVGAGSHSHTRVLCPPEHVPPGPRGKW